MDRQTQFDRRINRWTIEIEKSIKRRKKNIKFNNRKRIKQEKKKSMILEKFTRNKR